MSSSGEEREHSSRIWEWRHFSQDVVSLIAAYLQIDDKLRCLRAGLPFCYVGAELWEATHELDFGPCHGMDMCAVAMALRTCPNKTGIHTVRFRRRQEHFTLFSIVMQGMDSLRHVELSHSNVPASFLSTLSSLPKLTTLSLSHVRVLPRRALRRDIEGFPFLERLQLLSTHVDATTLLGTFPRLSRFSGELRNETLKMLAGCPNLRHLHVYDTQLCALRVLPTEWTSVVSRLYSLRTTDVEWRARTFLNLPAVDLLQDVLDLAVQLTELHVEYSHTGSKSEFLNATFLAEIVSSSVRLTHLTISPALRIDDASLCRFLTYNGCHLKSLSLASGSVQLGDKSVMAIARVCDRLEHLSLVDLPLVSDAGLAELACGACARSLQTLTVRRCGVAQQHTLDLLKSNLIAAARLHLLLTSRFIARGVGTTICTDAPAWTDESRNEKVLCTECGVTILSMDVMDHGEICPAVRVPCVLHEHGCDSRVQRVNMSDHLATCAKFVVMCPYCKSFVPRGNYHLHTRMHLESAESDALLYRWPHLYEGCPFAHHDGQLVHTHFTKKCNHITPVGFDEGLERIQLTGMTVVASPIFLD